MARSYRENVLDRLRETLAPIAPVGRALDFGAGDGWFARSLLQAGLAEEVVAVDVLRREETLVEPVIYDGETLPFEDRSFDLVYTIDTVHHADDPAASLTEAMRCSREHFVLKDHTYERTLTKARISVLDELGNRRFGVPSPHHYQRGWEWLPVFERAGFERCELRHPILCETRPVLSRLANDFQFIGRWRRNRNAAEQHGDSAGQ
jgi:SAM-dependent methyltransferase